jgi:hypothetical protein
MICDVMLESNRVLYNYEEAVFDMEQYSNLTDNVLYEISSSNNPILQKA